MKISRNDAKHYLTEYVRDITTKSKGGMYVCPLCGSGTGANGTGAFSITRDGERWSCFSCNRGGDVFDLIGAVNHLDGYTAQRAEFEKTFNVEVESAGTPQGGSIGWNDEIGADEPQAATDLTSFFLEANKRIGETDYHRGISLETLNRYHAGYDPAWKHPNNPNGTPTPRLIIPTGKSSYLARDTREYAHDGSEYDKMKVKPDGGTSQMFNLSEITRNTTKPLFIVEGEFDALSIIDVGGDAMALGSTQMANRLSEYVSTHRPTRPLILALDNDKAGRNATEKLAQSLAQNGILFYRRNITRGYKDANEALCNDREGLRANILRTEHLNDGVYDMDWYLQNLFSADLAKYNAEKVPTGIKGLDERFNGGLCVGLGAISGRSSIGKTTLAFQIADNIAQSGVHVLYWSLEEKTLAIAKRGITRKAGKTLDRIEDQREAVEEWRKALDNHLQIVEGAMHPDIDTICDETREYAYEHPKCVVFIDYLQIIQPRERLVDQRAELDANLTALYQLSYELEIPIVYLSRIQRSNYNMHLDESAIAESGKAEYTNEWMINLELACVTDDSITSDTGKGINAFRTKYEISKQENPRKMKIFIVKNRGGIATGTINFDYYPAIADFREITEQPQAEQPQTATIRGNFAPKGKGRSLSWSSTL